MPGARESKDARREQILNAALRVAAKATLAGVTTRAVAEEAGLSNGLVLFYFRTKDRLLMALLERVLEELVEGTRQAIEESRGSNAWDSFRDFLTREITRLPRERRQVELFFDFWVMGTTQPKIRSRMRDALQEYRSMISDMTRGLARAPGAFGGVNPDGMAAVGVSFIHGCALQATIDPSAFDVQLYVDNVTALVDSLAA